MLMRSQRHICVQGKTLLLITNSDFMYTNKMMSYAYDEYLPEGKTWRDLFDMVGHCLFAAGLYRVNELALV